MELDESGVFIFKIAGFRKIIWISSGTDGRNMVYRSTHSKYRLGLQQFLGDVSIRNSDHRYSSTAGAVGKLGHTKKAKKKGLLIQDDMG